MRFTLIAAPDADPGPIRARASATIVAATPEEVAAAARGAADPSVVLLGAGVRVHPITASVVERALEGGAALVGGARLQGPARHAGWMLAPAPFSPLRFELVAITIPAADPAADKLLRGPIDVPAPGLVIVARELLVDPLPADPVAAAVALAARARRRGGGAACVPAMTFEGPALDGDDRGRAAALREMAGDEAIGAAFRQPAALRARFVDRDVRLAGGKRGRSRVAAPAIQRVDHYDDAAGVAALTEALRVRGDRYVLVAPADRGPDAAAVGDLVDIIEQAATTAIAAPDLQALRRGCALLAASRIPQHVVPRGATVGRALQALADDCLALRRGVRIPGRRIAAPPPPRPRRARFVFAAGSVPEITHTGLDELLAALRPGDELVAACAAGATTLQRFFLGYPQVRVELDAADPLLTGAVNRAFGGDGAELAILVADDVLLPRHAVDRLRTAFDVVPVLGAAVAAIPGAPGAEGIADTNYGALPEFRALAERRALHEARRYEPVDVALTPALAVAREALDAVGGIDPVHGPTRRGIADLITRLRAAGYAVVRCDDAVAHRYDAGVSRAPAALTERDQPVPAADLAAIARGFDPASRVPFTRAGESAAPPRATTVVAVPVSGASELERAAALVAAAAAAYGVQDPVRIAILLDGELGTADAAARLRPVLAATPAGLHGSVVVRVERAADLRAWRERQDADTVLLAAGHERDALADLPRTDPARIGRRRAVR